MSEYLLAGRNTQHMIAQLSTADYSESIKSLKQDLLLLGFITEINKFLAFKGRSLKPLKVYD